MLFEGTEKKFEILVEPDAPDLRGLGPEFWREIVTASRATILNHSASDHLDAWLLSESSLFVSRRWAVMITCGRTTLIEGLLRLLERIPAAQIVSLIYERKNENFPTEQRTTFAQDVARLRRRIDGDDQVFGDPRGDHISVFHLNNRLEPDREDATVELLMHGIAGEVADLFTPDGPGRQALRRCLGLDDLLPGFALDDHVFAPQGYSLNAVRDRRYATMHVTPEREASYASFEMGWGFDDAEARRAVDHLLAVFEPTRADLLLFARRFDESARLAGYATDRRCSERLSCGYPVQYLHLVKE
ncbi:MAG TPA: hypothetical protein PLL30_01030 [Candidatus Krumholzibacteria bacterium]|nr:hypothetical protein [Candidatus Krumholzibacteria bacterium]HPD70345.1 hypothetical protein [Candidatus Krumholzibacteria bacterium]HRY39955.1 hypothetical protein [Candidatus Krumholzibacteria bacterium]